MPDLHIHSYTVDYDLIERCLLGDVASSTSIHRAVEMVRALKNAADARRYRWLKKNCQYGFEDRDGPQLVHRNGETGPHQNPRWREDLDTAIDAALDATGVCS